MVEVELALKELKDNKATGPENFNGDVLKPVVTCWHEDTNLIMQNDMTKRSHLEAVPVILPEHRGKQHLVVPEKFYS